MVGRWVGRIQFSELKAHFRTRHGIPVSAWMRRRRKGWRPHGPDSRDPSPRDMYEPDLHIDTLKLKAQFSVIFVAERSVICHGSEPSSNCSG